MIELLPFLHGTQHKRSWAKLPNSFEYRAACYVLRHLGSISVDELMKQYRSSCPKDGANEVLPNGHRVRIRW